MSWINLCAGDCHIVVTVTPPCADIVALMRPSECSAALGVGHAGPDCPDLDNEFVVSAVPEKACATIDRETLDHCFESSTSLAASLGSPPNPYR